MAVDEEAENGVVVIGGLGGEEFGYGEVLPPALRPVSVRRFGIRSRCGFGPNSL